MKIKLLLAALIIFGFITCTKDTFNTTPSLKFVSVNGNVFAQPSVVTFNLECTDKEGDVVDTIWIQRISRVSACESEVALYDSFPIPDFSPPKNVKAEFEFTFNYPGPQAPNLRACSQHDDTSYFRFWMHDKAQHVSDTVQSQDIVLLQQ
ncbi:MAG: hypothetical protein ABJA71_17700 [Ginsengibacter sp.]